MVDQEEEEEEEGEAAEGEQQHSEDAHHHQEADHLGPQQVNNLQLLLQTSRLPETCQTPHTET